MKRSDVPSHADRWHCGCRTWNADDTFYLLPCAAETCRVREIVTEETKRAGKPMVLEELE